MSSKQIRKVAAHEVLVKGRVLHQAIVELIGGRVVDCYPFSEEQPMTEWLGGTIEIRGDKAYWNEKRLQ